MFRLSFKPSSVYESLSSKNNVETVKSIIKMKKIYKKTLFPM